MALKLNFMLREHPVPLKEARPSLSEKIRELGQARRVSGFFIARAVRRFKWTFAGVLLLTVVGVGAQLGFLFVLERMLAAVNGTAAAETANAAARLLDGRTVNQMIALAIVLLGGIAVSDLASRWLVSRLSVRNFRLNMREVFHRLVEQKEGSPTLRALGLKGMANLFTKGSRYGALMGARTANMVRPIISIPAILAFCLWLSPLLTLLTLGIFCLAIPLHLLLIYRGLDSMHRLRIHGSEHMQSKKRLIQSLLEFPSWRDFDLKRMEEDAIDRGSAGYLKAYFDRRMLSGFSQFVNLAIVMVAIGLLLFLLTGDGASLQWRISQLFIFILAIRFLIGAIGQTVTDLTMIVSYTPLCADLFTFLNETAGGERSLPVAGREPVVFDEEFMPGLVVFSPSAETVPAWRRILAVATGEDRWLEAPAVRGLYAPHSQSIARDLLLAEASQPAVPLPPGLETFIQEVLDREKREGWSGALWSNVPPSARVYCTLNAALAGEAEAVLLIGPTQTQLGRTEWDAVAGLLAEKRIGAIQIIQTLPKRLQLPTGVPACFFDGRRFESLGRVASYDEILPALRERYDVWQRQDRSWEAADGGEEEDEVTVL